MIVHVDHVYGQAWKMRFRFLTRLQLICYDTQFDKMAVFVQGFSYPWLIYLVFISSWNTYCSNITLSLCCSSLYPMSVAALRNILRSRKKLLTCFTEKKGNNTSEEKKVIAGRWWGYGGEAVCLRSSCSTEIESRAPCLGAHSLLWRFFFWEDAFFSFFERTLLCRLVKIRAHGSFSENADMENINRFFLVLCMNTWQGLILQITSAIRAAEGN